MLEAVLRRLEIGFSQVRILSRCMTTIILAEQELWLNLPCGGVVNASLVCLALPSSFFFFCSNPDVVRVFSSS